MNILNEERGRAVTYVSADVQKLYEREFIDRQKYTASATSMGRDVQIQANLVHSVKFAGASDVPYDPVIVRFYEEVIQRLQIELTRYKRLVEELTNEAVPEPETGYSIDPPITMSEAFRKKITHALPPTLRSTEVEF